MLHYQQSSLIDAPLAQVWEFYERPDILDLLMPPWQSAQVLRREGGLGVGAESEFLLWLGPLPVRWLARHVACDPQHHFQDVQVSGPMQSWTHDHWFVAEHGKTRLTDAIAYSPPGGRLLEPVLGRWVQGELDRLFRYRHDITQRLCADMVR